MSNILAIDPGTHESVISERRRQQMRAANAKYRAANRERRNADQRTARAANLEKQAARMRDYRARKPDVIARIESRRVRPEGFREKFNAYRVGWAKENRDKLSEYAHKRSGRKIGRLPPGTIKATGDRQGWLCAACSTCLRLTGYHKDHILPLALGGEHSARNIQLLCPHCNLSKGAKHPSSFMHGRGEPK